MTWTALNHAGQTMGAPMVDYDRFAARWESDPILKKLVDRFDGNGLVIKTNSGEEPTQTGHKEREGKSQVSQMAKRATKLGK